MRGSTVIRQGCSMQSKYHLCAYNQLVSLSDAKQIHIEECSYWSLKSGLLPPIVCKLQDCTGLAWLSFPITYESLYFNCLPITPWVVLIMHRISYTCVQWMKWWRDISDNMCLSKLQQILFGPSWFKMLLKQLPGSSLQDFISDVR